ELRLRSMTLVEEAKHLLRAHHQLGLDRSTEPIAPPELGRAGVSPGAIAARVAEWSARREARRMSIGAPAALEPALAALPPGLLSEREPTGRIAGLILAPAVLDGVRDLTERAAQLHQGPAVAV